VFARPEKVHRIRHDGRYFQVEATHLCEPSPQRTPLIYQAGASSRGRQVAAMHAECVFINGPSKQVIAPIVADLRRRAAAAGRNPAEILIFTMMTVITAATSEAARAKLEDYRSYVSEEGALVLMSGWTGLDFSKYRTAPRISRYASRPPASGRDAACARRCRRDRVDRGRDRQDHPRADHRRGGRRRKTGDSAVAGRRRAYRLQDRKHPRPRAL
jgi:alkanesulfonate monooxygenase SsuD/methylene tetrahydromethanopterin reductase-like flavin-dependent oxidoreductase (luciferase family)